MSFGGVIEPFGVAAHHVREDLIALVSVGRVRTFFIIVCTITVGPAILWSGQSWWASASASTSAFGSPTSAAPMSRNASVSEIVSIVVFIVAFILIRVRFLKGLKLVEESFYLRLHRSVGLIGRCEFGCMLGGGGWASAFVNLEALHHLIYDDIGVVKATLVDRYFSLSQLKASLLEVVFEIFPCLVRRSGVFKRTDVVFENSLFV